MHRIVVLYQEFLLFFPMWKTVMWFFFFSMIKRMLQPSKSMLSSNLCETWDLILNSFYNEAVALSTVC